MRNLKHKLKKYIRNWEKDFVEMGRGLRMEGKKRESRRWGSRRDGDEIFRCTIPHDEGIMMYHRHELIKDSSLKFFTDIHCPQGYGQEAAFASVPSRWPVGLCPRRSAHTWPGAPSCLPRHTQAPFSPLRVPLCLPEQIHTVASKRTCSFL